MCHRDLAPGVGEEELLARIEKAVVSATTATGHHAHSVSGVLVCFGGLPFFIRITFSEVCRIMGFTVVLGVIIGQGRVPYERMRDSPLVVWSDQTLCQQSAAAANAGAAIHFASTTTAAASQRRAARTVLDQRSGRHAGS